MDEDNTNINVEEASPEELQPAIEEPVAPEAPAEEEPIESSPEEPEVVEEEVKKEEEEGLAGEQLESGSHGLGDEGGATPDVGDGTRKGPRTTSTTESGQRPAYLRRGAWSHRRRVAAGGGGQGRGVKDIRGDRAHHHPTGRAVRCPDAQIRAGA